MTYLRPSMQHVTPGCAPKEQCVTTHDCCCQCWQICHIECQLRNVIIIQHMAVGPALTCMLACSPPMQLQDSTTRVVYLFGNPLLSVCSHYRRGHAYHQVMHMAHLGMLAVMTPLCYYRPALSVCNRIVNCGQHIQVPGPCVYM